MRPALRQILFSGMLPETRTLVGAISVRPDAARIGHINTLIKRLKLAGVWDKTDVLYMLAAHTSQAARLNWKSPSQFVASDTGTPTFTADRGFTGDGATAKLDTTWNPATAATNYTLNSAHIACWTVAANADTLRTVGNNNAGIFDVGGASNLRVNAASSTNYTSAASGYSVGVRPDATQQIPYFNGVAAAAGVVASSSITSAAMHICGGFSNFALDQVGAMHAGGALTAGEVAASHAALLAYMQAVGAAA